MERAQSPAESCSLWLAEHTPPPQAAPPSQSLPATPQAAKFGFGTHHPMRPEPFLGDVEMLLECLPPSSRPVGWEITQEPLRQQPLNPSEGSACSSMPFPYWAQQRVSASILRLTCFETEPEQLHGMSFCGCNTYRGVWGAVCGLCWQKRLFKAFQESSFARWGQQPPQIQTARTLQPPATRCHSSPPQQAGSRKVHHRENWGLFQITLTRVRNLG